MNGGANRKKAAAITDSLPPFFIGYPVSLDRGDEVSVRFCLPEPLEPPLPILLQHE
jgi:hypothetical protein